MGGFRTPGPFCQIEDPLFLDDGTLCRLPSQLPGDLVCRVEPLDVSLFSFGRAHKADESCCDEEGKLPGLAADEHPTKTDDQAVATYSGAAWVDWADKNAPNSNSLDKLVEPFQSNVKAFIGALEAAGAKVKVKATLRHANRAYLFHWSWLIALKKVKPKNASPKSGVPIIWDHGHDADSVAAAWEMVHGFGLAVPPNSLVAPALSSVHIRGEAIDMDIKWTGAIQVKNKDGTTATVQFNANPNLNTKLHAVGATYGVKRLVTDKPHWSINGH
jgi:hypothetical protein